MELKDKVALVTGCAVRVGRVIALTLAERGCHIVMTYLTEAEPYQETAAEIQAKGVKVLALPMNVQTPGDPARVVTAAVARFGRVDLLVNNASVWLKAPFLEITEQAWRSALDINLTGPFLMSQAVAPHMLRQKAGLIVNITDLSAYQTWAGYAHHSASKAGLVALTRVMAAELAPDVRVNAIAPGTVLLPDNADEAKVQWAVENSLLKRIGTPEDVARTVVFLAESDFITGAVYFVDGGRALV
ncbi:MAG: beta-ketoacyl-ACP reductase [Chloroflexota bacterium]|nr:MAG: beta-ketoacyl-ACP reductase [Chloroflexota bacterium]